MDISLLGSVYERKDNSFHSAYQCDWSNKVGNRIVPVLRWIIYDASLMDRSIDNWGSINFQLTWKRHVRRAIVALLYSHVPFFHAHVWAQRKDTSARIQVRVTGRRGFTKFRKMGIWMCEETSIYTEYIWL